MTQRSGGIRSCYRPFDDNARIRLASVQQIPLDPNSGAGVMLAIRTEDDDTSVYETALAAIGKAIAFGYAEHGAHVVIASRKLDNCIAVADEIAEQVVEAIVNTARTGKIGDGKIFVTQLEEVVRIRTGETGSEAV